MMMMPVIILGTETTSWALSHLPQADDDQAEGRVHLSAVREKEEAVVPVLGKALAA